MGNSIQSDPCAEKKTCDPNDVDAAKKKQLVGDILAGVGIVSIGVAGYMWLSSSKASSETKPSATLVDFVPVPGGTVGRVRGSF